MITREGGKESPGWNRGFYVAQLIRLLADFAIAKDFRANLCARVRTHVGLAVIHIMGWIGRIGSAHKNTIAILIPGPSVQLIGPFAPHLGYHGGRRREYGGGNQGQTS